MKQADPVPARAAENARTTWESDPHAMLQRLHELVSRLDALSVRQRDLIHSRETGGLIGVLNQRQAVIDEFTVIQSSLGLQSDGLNRHIQALEPAMQRSVRAVIREIGVALESVMRRDAEDQAFLTTSRNQVRSELATAEAGLQAQAAYVRGGPVARRADHKG